MFHDELDAMGGKLDANTKAVADLASEVVSLRADFDAAIVDKLAVRVAKLG